MSPALVSVNTKTTLEQADHIFTQAKVSTVPVLTPAGNAVAVMTDFSLLTCLLKRNLEQGGPTGGKNLVGNYLTELDPVVTIDADEPITNAFKFMIQSPTHRLYVTEGGALKGALSPKDMLRFFQGPLVESQASEGETPEEKQAREKVRQELDVLRHRVGDYEQVFLHSPYLMHSMNLEGEITMANHMLHLALGYEPGELLGKSMYDIYPSSAHKDAEAGLQTVQSLGFHPFINVLMVKKNKELVKVDIATSLRKNDKGKASGTITIGRLNDNSAMLAYLQHASHLP